MDAYRAEVHGIYSLLLLIKIICDYYKVTTGSIEIACDCLSALNQCLTSTIPPKSTQHDFDLIRAIYDIRQLLPITIKSRHVYGHQDDKNITLSKWERLNCECDRGAKIYMHQLTRPLYPTKIFGSQWKVKINKVPIIRRLKYNIIEYIHGSALRNHILKRENIPQTLSTTINWTAIRSTNRELHKTASISLAKHVSGFLSCGTQMDRRKEWLNNSCPRCASPHENNKHILLCNQIDAQTCYRDSIITLKKSLIKIQTHPLILTTFIAYLSSRNTQSMSSSIPYFDYLYNEADHSNITDAAIQQDKLGWHLFTS